MTLQDIPAVVMILSVYVLLRGGGSGSSGLKASGRAAFSSSSEPS